MGICKVDGCNNKVFGKEYCQKHYGKYRKYGNPLVGREYETHRMTNIPEYKVWGNIKARCYSKSYEHYKYYGGQGITVCDRWKNSFIAFYEDMGPKPFLRAEIDRIDNDGNYELNNCRWVTHTENIRKQKCNKLDMNMAREIRKEYYKTTGGELAKKYNVSLGAINCVVRNITWKENGFSKPVRMKKKRLDWVTVNSIRRLVKTSLYTKAELRHIYNINRSTLNNIIDNRAWKEQV